MKLLEKCLLNQEETFEYFKESIGYPNTISREILKELNFQKGNFFTLLPKNANLENLYKFSCGGILPQNPIQQKSVDGQQSYYTIIPKIDMELSEFIYKIQTDSHMSSLFDDILTSPLDKDLGDLFYQHGVLYGSEIYYLLDKKDASVQLIKKCLKYSHTFGHSLGLLALVDFSNQSNNQLSMEQIKEIIFKTKMVFTQAYDGEGYIFWESDEMTH